MEADGWAEREAKAGFGGLLAALPAKWVNHPHRIAACDQRPVQLAAAATCGLSVPDTVVTNDPDEARAFCADHPGGVIYKSLRGGPRTEDGHLVALYTTVVTEGDITDDVRHTAHLLHAAVPKAHEIRLTCVGERFFPLRIDARTPAGWIDWRADHDELDYAVTELPDQVATGIRAVMRHFGLVYAAIDLIVTPDGDIVFTGDLNSNGQWAWDHPLRESIADALAGELGGNRA